jgi:RNA polymerase sigma factor (sigma-70 family)
VVNARVTPHRLAPAGPSQTSPGKAPQCGGRARFLKGHRLRQRPSAGPDGLPLSRCARPPWIALTFRGRELIHPTARPLEATRHPRPPGATRRAPQPERREQIATFFAAHAPRLHTTVRAAARAPEPVIEDACQAAWTILLRRRDITLDERGLSWLATVAIHEAWRSASNARETPVGGFQTAMPGDGELPEPAHPDTPNAEDRALARIQHTERMSAVATLKPREREALYLYGLGYSYHEIGQLTNSSYTAVNRRITEGRAALRRGGRQPAT